MDKRALVDAIADHFEAEYEILVKAARATYEAATHEENRAENKYDTRGLEASYLAESQSKRARELQQTVNIYRTLRFLDFSEGDPIAMSALVTLAAGDEETTYFLGPRGGGAKISTADGPLTIITAASPLGRAMLGKEAGDELTAGPPQARRTYESIEVR